MDWIILLMVIFGLLYVIFFSWNYLTNDKDNRSFSAFLLTVSALGFFAFFATYDNRNIPTAMDVYQGKTTLEITYKDSVRIDSIVVFKDEFKK